MLADEHVKITQQNRGSRSPGAAVVLGVGLLLVLLIGTPLDGAPSLSPAESDEPEKPAAPERDTRALEILQKAAAAQGGKEIQAGLRNFHAHFTLEVHDPEKGQINLEVERIFDFSGEWGMLWTQKRHSGSKAPFSATVFNSEDAWRIGDKGKVTVFTDRPSVYKTDIRNIEDDTRLTAQLFRFFFLGALASEVSALHCKSDKTVDGESCHIVEGRIKAWLGGEGQTLVLLTMAVDKKSSLVRKVTIHDLARGGERRTFRFSRYIKNSQGVLIPGNIKIYGKDSTRHEMQIGLQVDFVEKKSAAGKTSRKAVPRMEFNVKVPAHYFKLPEEDIVPLPKPPWQALPPLK